MNINSFGIKPMLPTHDNKDALWHLMPNRAKPIIADWPIPPKDVVNQLNQRPHQALDYNLRRKAMLLGQLKSLRKRWARQRSNRRKPAPFLCVRRTGSTTRQAKTPVTGMGD